MEKKFKFSDLPMTSKVVYGAVIAILCISALIVGIVSIANRKPAETPTPDENPSIGDNADGKVPNTPTPTPPNDEQKKEPVSFVSPLVGKVITEHSLSVPVYSTTLGAWKMHTGIDIMSEENAEVFAAADGTVTAVKNDPMLGMTVEITHEGELVSVYSNLAKTLADGICEGAAVKAGDKLGTVGDTAIAELAEEPHLHFAVRLKSVEVNPLDYIGEASKKASLGIEEVTA